jgi:hypothetical protein
MTTFPCAHVDKQLLPQGTEHRGTLTAPACAHSTHQHQSQHFCGREAQRLAPYFMKESGHLPGDTADLSTLSYRQAVRWISAPSWIMSWVPKSPDREGRARVLLKMAISRHLSPCIIGRARRRRCYGLLNQRNLGNRALSRRHHSMGKAVTEAAQAHPRIGSNGHPNASQTSPVPETLPPS